ncbi:MAG TPA: efflux transporter outer membrane subunit [Geobacteraceae bacterium]
MPPTKSHPAERRVALGAAALSPGRAVRAGCAAAALLLAGCAVGPDFRAPAPPKTDAYTAAALPAETASAPVDGGASQRFVPGRDIPGQWWTLFQCAKLDRLIRQALADNPTLAAAQATLTAARENLRARTGSALYPQVDGKASVVRQEISGAAFGQPDAPASVFTLYNASVNVSYALDLAGGARRELEALRAQVDYQRFQLEGAWLSLTANVVTAAVQEAGLRAEIRATREIVAAQEKQLALVEQQLQLGGIARPDVLAQEAQLAQARATLPPLEKQLAQNRHLLAILAGKTPGEAASLPEFELSDLQLPAELPVSLPSALVRQRPDIRASEELLHAACAQVGVATANLFPQLTLTGSLGSETSSFGDLFSTGTAVWSLGAGVLQPIFHGGELTAKRRAAVAAFDQAGAQYRETVLQSFRDVADVLRALEMDAQTLKAEADAEAAARASLDLAGDQFRLGATSYLTLLNAERQHQQAKLALAQARAARYADTAALFKALGGGWWNRPPEENNENTPKKE